MLETGVKAPDFSLLDSIYLYKEKKLYGKVSMGVVCTTYIIKNEIIHCILRGCREICVNKSFYIPGYYT